MAKLIFLQDIDLKLSPMVRSHIREDVVEEYASIYKREKVKLPPIEVFTEDNKVYLLGDGAHRTYALMALKAKTVEANVHKGGREDALRYALTANERHGIRRSAADKRNSIKEAVRQWPKCSDSQVAAMCAVDKHTVTSVRTEMEKAGAVKAEPMRVGKDGKEHPAAKVEKKQPGKSPAGDTDEVGTSIPEFAKKFWDRRDEVAELLGTLRLVHKFLVATQKKEDLMYGEVAFSAALADLDKLHTNLSSAMPYAVCSQCQGQPKTQPKGECRMCKGRGLVSRFRFNSLVPSEIKSMIASRNKK